MLKLKLNLHECLENPQIQNQEIQNQIEITIKTKI